jgi:CubicO group peptidase (beta-lactamase class C family)
MSYAEFMQQKIFAPPGMKQTYDRDNEPIGGELRLVRAPD